MTTKKAHRHLAKPTSFAIRPDEVLDPRPLVQRFPERAEEIQKALAECKHVYFAGVGGKDER